MSRTKAPGGVGKRWVSIELARLFRCEINDWIYLAPRRLGALAWRPSAAGPTRGSGGRLIGWSALLGQRIPIRFEHSIHARLPARALATYPAKNVCVHAQRDLLYAAGPSRLN